MKLLTFAGAFFAAFFASSALATPVVWTLNGTLVGGKVITGTFTYDADTDIYSNVNISSNPNNVGPFTLPSASGLSSTSGFFVQSPVLSGQNVVSFGTSSALTNAGGTLSINSGGLLTCGNSPCTNYGSTSQTFASGTIVAAAPAATPVPALSRWTMALLGLVLAGVAAAILQRGRATI